MKEHEGGHASVVEPVEQRRHEEANRHEGVALESACGISTSSAFHLFADEAMLHEAQRRHERA